MTSRDWMMALAAGFFGGGFALCCVWAIVTAQDWQRERRRRKASQ